MIVVDLIKIILVNHLLKVALHPGSTQVLIRVSFLVTSNYILVPQSHVSQLVPQSQPAWHTVIGAAKKLNLFRIWRHSLYYSINLVWLSASLSNL